MTSLEIKLETRSTTPPPSPSPVVTTVTSLIRIFETVFLGNSNGVYVSVSESLCKLYHTIQINIQLAFYFWPVCPGGSPGMSLKNELIFQVPAE